MWPTKKRRMLTMLAVALLAAACGELQSPTSPGQSASAPEQSAQASDADGAAVAAVRHATAAFHDIDTAIAAGYLTPSGGHCDESPAGAMGVHSANPALLQSPALVPTEPEVLLYLPAGNGIYRLVGVEYVQTLLLRNSETGQVAPWFQQDPWPAQYVVVNSTPSLFGQNFQGPMPGHVPGMPWHYDLHVWTWAPNPNGMFAQWNPALQCG